MPESAGTVLGGEGERHRPSQLEVAFGTRRPRPPSIGSDHLTGVPLIRRLPGQSVWAPTSLVSAAGERMRLLWLWVLGCGFGPLS